MKDYSFLLFCLFPSWHLFTLIFQFHEMCVPPPLNTLVYLRLQDTFGLDCGSCILLVLPVLPSKSMLACNGYF